MNKELNNQDGQVLETSNIKPTQIDPIYGLDAPFASYQSKDNNNGAIITQESIDKISEQIGQNVVQIVATYLASYKPNVNNRTIELDNSIMSYLKELYKDSVYEDRSTSKKHYSNHLIISKQDKTMSMIDGLSNQVNQLTSLVESQNTTIAEQALIIKKQHEAIARYESDVIYKTQKDLIMELIGIADQLRMTLSDYSTNKEINLHHAIEQLEEWVDGSLQAVAVRKYINIDTQEFDRKRQEIIEVQETSNPEEDGMLKSLLPGYVWSVPMVGSNEMLQAEERPKKFEFIIRPEQMACLKYNKIEETSVSDSPLDSGPNSEISVIAEPENCLSDRFIGEKNEIYEHIEQNDQNKSKKIFWDKWS